MHQIAKDKALLALPSCVKKRPNYPLGYFGLVKDSDILIPRSPSLGLAVNITLTSIHMVLTKFSGFKGIVN